MSKRQKTRTGRSGKQGENENNQRRREMHKETRQRKPDPIAEALENLMGDMQKARTEQEKSGKQTREQGENEQETGKKEAGRQTKTDKRKYMKISIQKQQDDR